MVILDEPTNGLDPIERRAMLGRLTTLAKDHGKTIFVSTHVLPDVQAICDRVIVLAQGRVQLAGTIETLTKPPQPEHHLAGSGPLEQLAAKLSERGLPARVEANETESIISLVSPKPENIRDVWSAAAEVGVSIRSLAPATRPLEKIFIDTLRRSEQHHDQHNTTQGDR